MSYAASLLATYPSSYGPTNLLSDDFVQRTSYDNLYPSKVPYMSSGRLLSDDLAFDQMNYDSKAYRSSIYPLTNTQQVYPPTTKYPKPVATNQRKFPPTDSFASLNDITEYSDSLATASHTNTASSMARSVDGPTNNMFANYHPVLNHNDNNDVNPPGQSNWNSPKTKPKGKLNTKTNPPTISQKKPVADEFDNDLTPVQSPRQHHLVAKNTFSEMTKPSPAIDIQAWVNDTEKSSPIDEKAAEQAWSVKIGQLHLAQAQREKEKAKSSRALPIPPKKVDPKSNPKSHEPTYQVQSESYFDTLFDGDYFRKPPPSDYSIESTLHHSTSKKNKFTNNSFDNVNTRTPKHVPPKKTPRYEPPTPKRQPPAITTTSWKKQMPKPFHYDSLYPYYSHSEFTTHELPHKDTDERFREALHKVRADRAEQQQKEVNEKTAKRMHYGDYVRHSTKNGLLQNTIRPSPWSDFMDLKKGNLYTISKEEKKQLYNQSKSYGERIRYRNFAIQYASETSRSHRHSVPLIEELPESETGDMTSHAGVVKSLSRTSKRPDSASTNKSHTKQTAARGGNRMMGNRTNRSNIRQFDDEHEHHSDYETNLKPRQKNVRYAKYDSSGRVINGDEDDENQENDT